MRIHGVRLRVSLKRVNVRSVLASSIHEVRYGSSNNDNNSNEKSPLSNRYFKGVYDALNNGGAIYQSSLPFHIRWDRIQRHLAVLGRVSTGNTVIPYRDSGEAFRVMWKAVDESKKSVLWQTYICKDDHVGQVTVSKLVAAQKRGCQTELLYDCGGNITGRRRLVEQLKHSGATVIEYRPILDHFLPYFLGGMKWERSPGIRNHRKILLVDDVIGFCGGLNIGNEYCGRSEGGTGRFRDTHCAVAGPAVADLREVYDDTKAPRPWKWSFARWRQIAATAVDRRYKQGKNVKEDYIVPMQRSVQQRGRVYLRRQMEKAEENRVFIMERMRWRRQREKLERLMTPWYRKASSGDNNNNNDNNGNNDVNKKVLDRRHTSVETTGKGGKEEENNNNNNNNNGDGVVSQGNSKIIHTPSSSTTRVRSCMQQQKLDYHQMQHLSPLEEKVLRELSVKGQFIFTLQDEDPVPEAEEYSKTRPAVTQVLSCNPHTRDWSIPYAFWQVSQKAHRRLWVTTPYYMPHRKLMRALLRASRRGVDVRILAGSNTTTDPWFMWYASNYITGLFLAAGVRVYEYKGDQVMHAKTVVVDSIWSSVGSYNWDMMSNKNMEVCVCHLDYKLAREMEKHFLDDLKVSVEVKYEDYKRRSLWVRFLSWFFYIGLQIAEKLTFRTFVDADLSSKID